ncbi:MAG: Oleate hydroxylase fah12 [Phylliscum demangeonii]|nr:MAG: Oleate hydroxylase fah12 [Phylliscum demangeonii]
MATSEPYSTALSSSSSLSVSPAETPNHSASTTSLSSLSSIGGLDGVASPPPAKLVDGVGNEFHVPDFTIKQIRDAIPAHCFERSAATGLYYVARDIGCLAATFALFHRYLTPDLIPSTAVRTLLWILYSVLQGLFGTGLWVLAHECGHQSFSTSKTLNDTVGWICHSALLVPYFAWKITHGKHHKATAHLERDMVYMPKTRDQYAAAVGRPSHALAELLEDSPLVAAASLLQQQLGGWLAYLATNASGHDFHERQPEGRGRGKRNGFGTGVNHFNPASPLFDAKDAHLIWLSDLGLLIMAAVLHALGQRFGWANLAVWYFAPYVWINHWLVAITYLQHTDPSLPHYTPQTWTFTRGATATIDRNFGFVGRHLFHGIIETHVLHHFVSTIPFYHADEATAAIKPIMGRHYRASPGGPGSFLTSLWTSARMCQWIEPNVDAQGEGKGILFYRNRNGLGAPHGSGVRSRVMATSGTAATLVVGAADSDSE